MKLMRTCREVTRLVLEGEDRRLHLGERLGVRLHMMVCKTCPAFADQVALMRQAMGRWKQYAESGDAPPPDQPKT
ncbi:MAG: zf-HC2 domain-containing protein [Rubrivivax sp.]|nr:zf-HC2 domain-containing protein [Rubrivivax sp.]MDP3083760.1 zf-HC2 domain-containing protein [Rubrivivax sp.]